MAVKVKTGTCPGCGGVVIKLDGPLSKVCHDKCSKCRKKEQE